MNFRLKAVAVLVAAPALVAAVLTGLPAQATDPGLVLGSPTVAIYPSGSTYYGKVFATCKFSTKSCIGKVWWGGDAKYGTSYRIAPRKSAYLTIRMTGNNTLNPYRAGNPPSQSGTHGLYVDEARPYNRAQAIDALGRTIEKKKSGIVSGTFDGSAVAAPTNLRATLFRLTRTQLLEVRTDHADGAGHFAIAVPTGVNNTPTGTAYVLRVQGETQDGEMRSWYWRGTNGVSWGGTKWPRDATKFGVSGDGYSTPVTYGAVQGTVTGGNKMVGVDITVAAPPPTFPKYGSDYFTTQRELDLEACGNVFGETETTTGGLYEVGFLPVDPRNGGVDKRYMIKASSTAAEGTGSAAKPTMRLWNNQFRSCIAAIKYPDKSSDYQSIDRSDLLVVPTVGALVFNPVQRASNASIQGNVSFGTTPTTYDKLVRIREYLPYRKILDSPVVVDGLLVNGSARKFSAFDLPPGKYWVEIGRATGCTAWLRSRYPNNKAYFNGEDRGAEGWKSFRRLSSLSSSQRKIAIAHGATSRQNSSPGSGYQGWAYREYCPTNNTGAFYETPRTVFLSDADSPTPSVVDLPSKHIPRGATIRGHVSRTGGRTSKEMLVTAYVKSGRNYGNTVPHTALTNGSGNYVIRGLPTGSYKVDLNDDSWRGIGRTFKGARSKSVKTGGSYSMGSQRAKF